MSFLETITRAKAYLEQQGRVSLRALRREFALDDDALDELVEELVDVQQVAVREGAVLVSTRAPRGAEETARTTDETRKVISIIFADLMGSTALQERLDPESVNRVMDAYYQAVRGPVEAAGGTVVQLLGDGVLCAFGIPRIAEDDALRAVRAAVGIQQAFREFLQGQQWLSVPIGLRVAVNTGEVVVSDEHPAGIGDPLNVAARLQQEARDGEVLIGQATRRLVADAVTLEQAGVFALKGRAETVAAYRVVSLERPTGAAAAAFVGRDEELARITAVYAGAVATPAARLAVLLGSPGLGKSRLIDEVGRRLGDGATVITAQCDAAGGATFAPVASALREILRTASDRADGADGADDLQAALHARIAGDDVDRARIAAGITALLSGSSASPEETFFVIRRFLTGLAASKPVVLVIDDLHWAEPLLLDLVEHLVQWGSGVPLLVLVGARPELRDLRSTLATPGGFVSDVVTLGGLDAGAAMRLAANVIGASDLPSTVAAKVLATSEGNPLFVGELVRMLVDEGAIERQGDRWIIGANLAALEMPPTIHALLAARIERLRPEEREVLERAAVVGRHFSRSAVAALLGDSGSSLDARLEALRRTELIESDAGWFLGEPVLRFHHVLIRDAAYRRLLKGTRAELHQRLADWIEAQAGGAAEHDETIGWHFEQAHQLLGEIGPLDDKGRGLGERAAQRLAAAGRRALAGDDVALAGSLLGRAIDRLDAADAARAELALDWCEALLSAGDVSRAVVAIAELGRFVGAEVPSPRSQVPGLGSREHSPDSRTPTPDPRLLAWHTCFNGQLTALTAPQELQATANAVAMAAEQLAKLGDAAGEAKAHSVHAQALARLGKVGACEAALDKALAAARKAGDRRRANAVLAGAPVAALWGPSPVTRASGRCLDVVRVLRITQGAPAVEAVALSCQGVLEALRGRTDAARRMIASSRKMVEELGIAHRLFEADAFAGRIDLLEGNAAAAERSLRGAYDGLRDLGLGIDAARAGALLARALLTQGRVDEAAALSHESEALAGDDLQAAIAWRGVRAEALAHRGDTAAAVALAEAAVAIAAATDALLDHADACLALAAALRAAGRDREADAQERRAIELWEAKGATLLAERARQEGRRVEPGAAAAPARSAQPADRGRSVERRVRPNGATAMASAFDAAFAAGDTAAMAATFADAASIVVIDHPTGSRYGRAEALDSYRRLLRMNDPVVRHEPLATLGESIGLFRRRISAQGSTGGVFDVADFQRDEYLVTEHNASIEIFATDHLGDAVARFYQLHAERTQDERAATTARAVAWMSTTSSLAREEAFAPGVEAVDHRTTGYGALEGSVARQTMEAWRELADDFQVHLDDVLGATPDAFLRKSTNSGIWRESGGAFARSVCALSIFGPDGRVVRHETFEDGREGEALARFDEVVGTDAASIPATHRRLRTSAAAAALARLEAAFAARDLAAIERLNGESMENVEHDTGASYGRDGLLETTRRMLRQPGLTFHAELLATLGEEHTVYRRRVAARGAIGTSFDVAAYEMEHVVIHEHDETGCRRMEAFAADQLAATICRLYERRAAVLPGGPARRRAEGTARALGDMFFRFVDNEGLGRPFAADVVWADHRVAGVGTVRGEEAAMAAVRAFLDLVRDTRWRADDILGCTDDALLVRATNLGTDRTGGGAFERTILSLTTFADDGAIARWETYDADREAEALARFDVLTAVPAAPPARRRVRPNAASDSMARIQTAMEARDLAGIQAEIAESFEEVSHPTGVSYGRAGMLDSTERWLRQPGATARHELLATLGDRLGLFRRWMGARAAGSGRFDVGEHEKEEVGVNEVDSQGLGVRNEIFAVDHLGDAIALLYRRYAEQLPIGEDRNVAAVTAQGVAHMLTSWVAPDLALIYDPSYVDVDHRSVGYGAVSRDDAMSLVRSFEEVATDVRFRVDDVLDLTPRGLVRRTTSSGIWRDGGGSFERALCTLTIFGGDGRITRHESWDGDRAHEALARFDELVASTPAKRRRLRPNAASTAMDRIQAAQLPGSATRHEYLATLGNELLLHRRWTGADAAGRAQFIGQFETEEVGVFEGDGRGGPTRHEIFSTDRLGDAIVLLYRRYSERLPMGPARERAVATARTIATALGPAELDAWCGIVADAFHLVDHRAIGIGSLHGGEAMRENFRAMFALEERFSVGVDDVLALEPSGILLLAGNSGTVRASGGAYERRFLQLWMFDRAGLMERFEYFDADRGAEALARFAELAGVKDNAVIEALNRWQILDADVEPDWEMLRASCVPDMVFEDRQGFARLSGNREMMIASLQERVANGGRAERRLLGIAGERIASTRMLWAGGPAEGRFEIEYITVMEADEAGQASAIILFGPEQQREAQREMWARWATIDPDAAAATSAYGAVLDAANEHDLQRYRALFADSLVIEDHRHGVRIEGLETYVQQVALLWQHAPDVGVDGGWFWPAIARHGGVTVTRRAGAIADEFLWLFVLKEDRIGRIEVFALDQVDAAAARLGELCPASLLEPQETKAALQIPPNAATAAVEQVLSYIETADWDSLRSLCAPIRFEDRRPLFRTTGDCEQFVINSRFIHESGIRPRRTILATAGDRLQLHHVLWRAEAQEQASEVETLEVFEVDQEGRVIAGILFDAEERVAAENELTARHTLRGGPGSVQGLAHRREAGPDPAHRLIVPPNSATRALGRMRGRVASGDIAVLRELVSEDFLYDDRSKRALVRGGVEVWARAVRFLFEEAGGNIGADLVATAGDRLALHLAHWERRIGEARSVIENYRVTEVDAAGKLRALILFDPDDRAAASRELFERYAAQGADGAAPALLDITRAWNDHDLDWLRSLLPDDFYLDDRRRTGVGRIEDAAGYLASLAALWDLSPDLRIEMLYIDRIAAHGRLYAARWSGTHAEGSDFDAVHVCLGLISGDRLIGFEIFELDDLEAARVRFEELADRTQGAR